MGARQHLRCVRIQRAIVDVQTERDGRCESEILLRRSHCGIGKEEGACNQGANYHGVPTTQKSGVAHEAREDGAKDAAGVRDQVVAPLVVWASLAGVGVAAREVSREEDVEERVGEPDQGPGEPDQKSAEGELFGRKEAAKMGNELAKAEAALLAMGRGDGSAGVEGLDCDRSVSTILGCHALKPLDNVFVATLAEEEFGSLMEADDCDS